VRGWCTVQEILLSVRGIQSFKTLKWAVGKVELPRCLSKHYAAKNWGGEDVIA
jgi:hypothetical protein